MAKRSLDIIDIAHIPPFVNHIFNVFIIIYKYANQLNLHMQQDDNMLVPKLNLVLSLVV